MKNKKIKMLIFAIFILSSTSLILAQACTSENCQEEIKKDFKNEGIDLSGLPNDVSYCPIGVCSAGRTILPNSANYPNSQFPNARFSGRTATFSGPNGQITSPLQNYPSNAETGRIDNLVAGATQIIGMLGPLFSGMKEAIIPKEKDVASKDSSPDISAGFNVLYSGSKEEVNRNFKGPVSVATSDNKNTLISSQNEKSTPGQLTTTGNSLASSFSSNSITTVHAESTPIAEVSTNDKTEIILKNVNKEDSFPATTVAIIISFLKSNFVSAQTLSGQFVKFESQDVEMNGHDFSVKALKTFNNLEVGGKNLEFHSGENEFEFNGQKILFSRLLKDVPHGVNSISNKLDPNNKYKLQHYTNKLGELKDEEKTIYVTDLSTNLEKGPYVKLKINEKRIDMFS